MNRELEVAQAFVSLTDVLAETTDPLVLLSRLCEHNVHLVGADAAGVMMATARGRLRTMAASDNRTAMLELLQAQSGEGPCLECYDHGEAVIADDLTASQDRWPTLVGTAQAMGFRSAYALPLRAHEHTLGSLNLLSTTAHGLRPHDLALAQAFCDVVGVALVHWRSEPPRPSDLTTRTEAALSAKTLLESAKGMLAEHAAIHPSQAHHALLSYAQRHGLPPAKSPINSSTAPCPCAR
ncbi:GAF domain-containing protein [Streptomyces sp. AN091965]|uniref:GAF domain-containing protein n=1 Tax=Streptomyces sp. AN091965 TaxID=2927803 RepID=UPI001F62107E|nr:GAF domain-containing protein [Streptomyces sp. AN091965]MCI3927812.1 GAF and ANTAR domain-containing protein [Streptomyces sp. AN091965]